MGKPQTQSPVQSRGDLRERGEFTFPAKLVEGGQEQMDSGAWRINIVFERADRVWSDGNGAKKFVSGFTTDKEGNPFGTGSIADQIAESFEEATGGSLNVFSDDSIAEFVGHYFMLKDLPDLDKDGVQRTFEDKNGKVRNAYFTVAVEYLGEDYVYPGTPFVIDGDNASDEPESDPASDLVALLAGNALDELRGGLALKLVMESDMAEVKTVLGKALRGGLIKPKAGLLDLLIEKGYAKVNDDGVFVAADDLGNIPFE